MQLPLTLICIKFLTLISLSTEECSIVTDAEGTPKYLCSTIQDLEAKSVLLDVLISSGNNVSSSQLKIRKPNFSVTLQNKAKGTFTKNMVYTINRVSSILDLSKNVTILTTNTFENLDIQNISIIQGRLVNIQPGTFSKMKNIAEIHIVSNPLQRIQAGIFNNLLIHTLTLSKNEITHIERNAFVGMKYLKNLYLDGNLLYEFRSELYMHDAKQLEVLHLQNNLFIEIDRNFVKTFSNLCVLNLSNNKIVIIKSYAFEDLLRLESLNLAYNRIYELNDDIFPTYGFPILSKLNIAQNRLSDLQLTALDKLQEIKLISIGGNPWHCSCLKIIQNWISNNSISQVCDDEFYKGIRPICVDDDQNSNTCTFSGKSLYAKYNAVNRHFPKIAECSFI